MGTESENSACVGEMYVRKPGKSNGNLGQNRVNDSQRCATPLFNNRFSQLECKRELALACIVFP